MRMWPFGRRGGKATKLKEGRATAVGERKGPVPAFDSELPSSSGGLRKTPSRRSRARKRRTSGSTTSMHDVDHNNQTPPALTPPELPFAKRHTYPQHQSSAEDITALPGSRRLQQSPHLRPITQDHGIPYNFQRDSQSSLAHARERGKLQRPQSLRRPPATDSSLIRRKSSKRRGHDSVREEEIRAMSMPLPQKRPAGSSGGMLRRDSKKVKGPLNRHFERPTSDVSLPLEDSIHSSMSGGSDGRAFRVSALDMLSPRPKIRYSLSSHQYDGRSDPSPTSYQSKHDSRRDGRIRTSIEEEKGTKRSKTVDELADTLDAGALREILERDKRRREKKRKADDERLRRRLERRAEKQKAAEERGTPGTPHREVKPVVGLGIERGPSTPMEDVRPSTPPRRRPDELVTPTRGFENNQLPTPMDSPTEEHVVADAQAVRYTRASMSQAHTREPSNVSQMPELLSEMLAAREASVQSSEPAQDPNASGSLHPVVTADTAATSQKATGRRRSSEGRRMGVFASLFRRGRRSSQQQDPARTTPSEVSFSNTSRESMSRQPLPAHLVAPTQPITIKQPSSVPRRTMSKFREDLPEFPLSPPDSRVQSPEATAQPSAIAARRQAQPPSDLLVSSSSPGPGGRTDSPVSPGVPAAGLMSQSLASVDSEGSWLSGKPINRMSNRSQLRGSVGSAAALKRTEDFNASYEELGIPDDEYFKRLTPQPDERRRSAHSADMLARKASSTAMAAMDTAIESDVEDAEDDVPPRQPTPDSGELLQSSVGRQPTIIHRQPRVKSTEALLQFFQADKASIKDAPAATADEPGEQDSPTSDTEPVVLQRAQSVDLGKHHSRQLSAGSAKLLHIPAKRSSLGPKRSSSASQNKAPGTE